MRRTPLVRRTALSSSSPLRRRCRLNPVSPKRRRANAYYRQLRDDFLAVHQRCEYPAGCTQPATTVHHKRGRSGDRLNDVRYWAAARVAHNEYAETHTGHALEIGWLIRVEGVE